jgi:hypothetical protein
MRVLDMAEKYAKARARERARREPVERLDARPVDGPVGFGLRRGEVEERPVEDD